MIESRTMPDALSGKPLATEVMRNIRTKLAEWTLKPHIVSVLASDDEASQVYVQSKAKRAERLGVQFTVHDLGANATQQELHQLLQTLSADPKVHGIVLELPLAMGLDADSAMLHIAQHKDVEGLSPANLALIAAGREQEAILPPTPRSVTRLIRKGLGDKLQGKRCAIIGPGRTVGRPLAFMLNNRGITVTLCNQHTQNLAEVLKPQDAIAVAVGKAGLLRPEHIQPHHVVVDAGINVNDDGSIIGDAVADLPIKAQSPVPGGVGPLTSALMFENLIRAIELQEGS